MNKKYKFLIKTFSIFIGVLIFTTPNQIFKNNFNITKIEKNENTVVQRYLDKNENFEGVGIIKKNSDNTMLCKNEDAYIVFKNFEGKYYNNVNVKEEKNGIIVSYSESTLDDNYKNDLYNSRVDEVMVLRIKANNNINNIEIVNN